MRSIRESSEKKNLNRDVPRPYRMTGPFLVRSCFSSDEEDRESARAMVKP